GCGWPATIARSRGRAIRAIVPGRLPRRPWHPSLRPSRPSLGRRSLAGARHVGRRGGRRGGRQRVGHDDPRLGALGIDGRFLRTPDRAAEREADPVLDLALAVEDLGDAELDLEGRVELLLDDALPVDDVVERDGEVVDGDRLLAPGLGEAREVELRTLLLRRQLDRRELAEARLA